MTTTSIKTATEPKPRRAAGTPISPTGGVRGGQSAQPGAPVSAAALLSGTVSAAAPGQPSAGPVAPPDDPTPAPAPGPGPGPGPTPTPGPSPTPSPTPTPDPTPTPSPTPGGDGGGTGGPSAGSVDNFANAASASFFDLIRNAASPDAQEAQNIILRRIALEGDVVASRVPAPRNITEIGGYLNLLTDWNELEMRSQVLAGILGVAGPNPPLGWTAPSSALGLRPLLNDRPAGAGQASLPVTVLIRNDFYDPLMIALTALHDRGCVLALLSGPLALPAISGTGTAVLNPLDYLGRVLRIAPSQALADAANDPLAIIRATGTTDPFALAARSLSPGTVAVTPGDYDALELSGTAIASVAIAAAPMVPLGPILAAAGYSIAGPVPIVGGPPSDGWARFTNVAGLIPDQTRLGDEMALLHSPSEIAASAFAAMQNWTWRGTAFAP